MTDPPSRDDDLVSAVLDDEASEAERQQVTDDPRLADRLAEFEAVAREVARPPDPPTGAVRDDMIAQALQEGSADDVLPRDAVGIDDASTRRRTGPIRAVVLAAAAAVAVLALAGGLVAIGDGDDAADQASGADGDAEPETAGAIAMPELDLGSIDDAEMLRLRLEEATGLTGDGETEAFAASEDADPADEPTPATDGVASAPGTDEQRDLLSREDCSIELVETRPELIGQLADGVVTYLGQPGFVFVYNDAAAGGAVGIVTSTTDCAVIAEVTL